MVSGPRRGSDSYPNEPSTPVAAVRETLERLFVPAVSRSPCLVAFSGGRDSSAILALAVHVARRHGLPDPIPVTLRFPHNPRTWEVEWQQQVMRHLNLTEWEILEIGTELDALGPIAREVLERHGLYWPANAHTMVPLARAASGGALMVGNGGDEVFSSLVHWKLSAFQVAMPLKQRLFRLSLLALPTSLRRRVWARKALHLRWLRPAAMGEMRKRLIERQQGKRAWNLPDLLRNLDHSRYLELTSRGGIFPALARDAGTELHEPFLDRAFFRAVISASPQGFSSRGDALGAFFADLLPDQILNRSTKAVFTEAFSGGDSRAFAEQWDGTGLDDSLVDADELRRQWLKPKSDLRSLTPLQAAWLSIQTRTSPAGMRDSTQIRT